MNFIFSFGGKSNFVTKCKMNLKEGFKINLMEQVKKKGTFSDKILLTFMVTHSESQFLVVFFLLLWR